MVRDPGRAPSGQHPSQGGQPDRQERHRTHSTSASDLRTTPSTTGGGRPPPHPRKSSGSGAGASGSISSGGRTPGVTTGAASRGSTPQTSIPVTTSAPIPFIPAAPMQDLIGRIFDVKLQQFASEMGLWSTPSRSGGGASTEQEDTTRRRRSRSSHADDAEPRSRRSRRSSPDADRDRRLQPVPLVELELDEYGVPEGDSLRVLGTMVREVCKLYLPDDAIWSAVPVNQRYQMLDIATCLAAKYGPVSVRHKNAKARVESRREKNIMVTNPYGHQGFGGFRARFSSSNTEVGADDTAGADDGADGAAGGRDVGAEDDGAKFSKLDGNGDESEEDDQGQAPQQERVEEAEEAEEEAEDSSRFEIRAALRASVQPALTEAQRIISFVRGGESSAPRTLPQRPVLQAIPLGPPSGVLRAIPTDPQPSVARTVTPRTVTPQPPAARAVVSDPSRAQTTVPEPSSRQIRAQTQPASARGTEEQRGKKSKKSKK
ncbi:hypothetical protein R1sor_002446 [Riccia sorocarpa]|uniref:Uncharacterized protein n=1 Tax=Riccia sorocarpa TaxID=122646 RepID=A0ABD3H4X2_9MARC